MIWGFPKIGLLPVIIPAIFSGFPWNKNHPAIGVSAWLWRPNILWCFGIYPTVHPSPWVLGRGFHLDLCALLYKDSYPVYWMYDKKYGRMTLIMYIMDKWIYGIWSSIPFMYNMNHIMGWRTILHLSIYHGEDGTCLVRWSGFLGTSRSSHPSMSVAPNPMGSIFLGWPWNRTKYCHWLE